MNIDSTPTCTTSSWIQQLFPGVQYCSDDLVLNLVLTAAVLLIATIIGYLMGRVVSRAPVGSDKNGHNGRFAGRMREELTSSGRLLAGITRVSIWIAALIAVAFIWFRTSLKITPT